LAHREQVFNQLAAASAETRTLVGQLTRADMHQVRRGLRERGVDQDLIREVLR
jgi:hypothetical protein